MRAKAEIPVRGFEVIHIDCYPHRIRVQDTWDLYHPLNSGKQIGSTYNIFDRWITLDVSPTQTNLILIPVFERERSHNVTRHQPKSTWQHRPNLLSQLCMPGLPPLHTATTDTRANAPTITPTILIELGNPQHFRPRLGGTHDMIESLLVGLQRRCTSRGA